MEDMESGTGSASKYPTYMYVQVHACWSLSELSNRARPTPSICKLAMEVYNRPTPTSPFLPCPLPPTPPPPPPPPPPNRQPALQGLHPVVHLVALWQIASRYYGVKLLFFCFMPIAWVTQNSRVLIQNVG